jgi:hypothetical protein
MLWSLGGRPRLLLPTALWNRLDDDQRRTLLAHELAHLRRGDPWVRGVELLATGLFWWHPVLWLARRELREAEEQCCDAWVLWALPGSARAYATALVCTVDYLCEARAALPAVASGFGQGTLLKRRLTMIMRGTAPRTLSWSGALAALGLGIMLLPTWAQDRPGRSLPPAEEEQAQDDRDDSQRREEMEKLRRQMEEMARQMERLHEQMRQTEERMRRSKQRIEELSRQRERAVPREEGPRDVVRPLPSTPPRAPRAEPPRPRVEAQPRPTVERLSDQDRRLMEMEEKLERVLQEVRALSGAVRQMRQSMPRGPGQPGFPGRPGGPGSLPPDQAPGDAPCPTPAPSSGPLPPTPAAPPAQPAQPAVPVPPSAPRPPAGIR